MSGPTLAFPTLTDRERRGLEAAGIDPEASLREWLARLTGHDPHGTRMDELIHRGLREAEPGHAPRNRSLPRYRVVRHTKWKTA